MPQIVKPAIAGSLESSDVQISIAPNPGRGIEIHLDSTVNVQFGDAILATVRSVLNDFGIAEAKLVVSDKGAVDAAIKARMQAVVCRAAEIRYDWSREDGGMKGVTHGC
jgi:citrate lyase acyl carrier protein